MIIKVLGTGCPKCKKLDETVREIIKENNITAEVIKITQIDEIVKYGVMSTPALVINEQVKSSGIIPKAEKILEWLKEN